MPNEIYPGMRIDFKQNSVDGFPASGAYHGVISYRSYGYGNDLSGGPAFQLAISDAGNLWIRKSTGPTSWSAWGESDRLAGYEIPSAVNCSGGHFETHVYCSSGKKVLGGGCHDSAATERAIVRTNPIGDSGWQCRSRDINNGQYTCLYAYAICATR